MSFARKQEQGAGNTQPVQRVVKQVIFQRGHANVVGTGHDVGWRADLINLKDCRLAVIALPGLPGTAAEIVGIIYGQVVVPPVGDILHRPRASNRRFESRGLRDQPVGHVPAVTGPL